MIIKKPDNGVVTGLNSFTFMKQGNLINDFFLISKNKIELTFNSSNKYLPSFERIIMVCILYLIKFFNKWLMFFT